MRRRKGEEKRGLGGGVWDVCDSMINESYLFCRFWIATLILWLIN